VDTNGKVPVAIPTQDIPTTSQNIQKTSQKNIQKHPKKHTKHIQIQKHPKYKKTSNNIQKKHAKTSKNPLNFSQKYGFLREQFTSMHASRKLLRAKATS
jgi:hypothetical protein